MVDDDAVDGSEIRDGIDAFREDIFSDSLPSIISRKYWVNASRRV